MSATTFAEKTASLVPDTRGDESLIHHPSAPRTSNLALEPTVTSIAKISRSGHHFGRVAIHAPDHGVLQPRLAVSQPGDPYELEADRMADQVMRMAAPSVLAAGNPIRPLSNQEGDQHPELSRAAMTGMLHRTTAEGEELPPDATSRTAEEDALQAQSQPGQTPTVTPTLEAQIQAPRGGGEPLSPAVRSFMEPRFGHDFGRVRVHTDERAAQSARGIGALAYTVGSDVVFAKGQFAPDTMWGKRLLAHELTHVVQQRGIIQRWNDSGHKRLSMLAFEDATSHPNFKKVFSSKSRETSTKKSGTAQDYDFPGRIAESPGYWAGLALRYNPIVHIHRFTSIGFANIVDWATETRMPKGEGPLHGEGANYKSGSIEENTWLNVKKVDDLVDEAVRQQDPDKAARKLAWALHAAEDRGSHWEGIQGFGHNDPRETVKVVARGATKESADRKREWYPGRKGSSWSTDDPRDNPQGWDRARRYATQVLKDYISKKTKSDAASNESTTELGMQGRDAEANEELKRRMESR